MCGSSFPSTMKAVIIRASHWLTPRSWRTPASPSLILSSPPTMSAISSPAPPRADAGVLAAPGEPLDHLLVTADPADPQRRRDDLAEAVRLEDEAGAVEAQQRRQRLAFVAEVAVDVVLEDDDFVLLGKLEQTFAPGERRLHAGRQLEGRDHVHQLRPHAVGLHREDLALAVLAVDAFGVDRDGAHVGFAHLHVADRVGEAGGLDEDAVAGVDEGVDREG